MKIAVIDDERPARKELIFLLESILEDAEFLEADSAESAIELVKNEKIQAFFLDINLGEVKGTTLASIIREKQPDAGIVFVTAYENYAVEAFELDAVDYVMKPFDMKRLQKAVEKLKNQGFLEMKPAQKETTLKPHAGKIAVNGGDRIHLIDLKEIIVVEANQRSCRICTKNHVYEENITMSHMEEKLQGYNFYRVHKSYLVNLDYVEELIPSYNNGYAMKMKYLEERIPISRTQVKNVRNLFVIQ